MGQFIKIHPLAIGFGIKDQFFSHDYLLNLFKNRSINKEKGGGSQIGGIKKPTRQ
jgi:hypothetical protein